MFLDAQSLRLKFGIKDVPEGAIDAAVSAASLKARHWFSNNDYETANGEALLVTDENYLKQASIVESHAHLAMWYLIGAVGVRLSGSGFVKSVQATGSPTNPVLTNSFLTPPEIGALEKKMLEKAHDFAAPYAIVSFDTDISDPVQVESSYTESVPLEIGF